MSPGCRGCPGCRRVPPAGSASRPLAVACSPVRVHGPVDEAVAAHAITGRGGVEAVRGQLRPDGGLPRQRPQRRHRYQVAPVEPRPLRRVGRGQRDSGPGEAHSSTGHQGEGRGTGDGQPGREFPSGTPPGRRRGLLPVLSCQRHGPDARDLGLPAESGQPPSVSGRKAGATSGRKHPITRGGPVAGRRRCRRSRRSAPCWS